MAAAETLGRLAGSAPAQYPDAWCRPAMRGQNRNQKLSDRTRVPALREWAAQPPTSRSGQAAAESSISTRAQRRPQQHDNDNDDNQYFLSEVMKSLRLHPEAKSAVREHFNKLLEEAEREHREQAGEQEKNDW